MRDVFNCLILCLSFSLVTELSYSQNETTVINLNNLRTRLLKADSVILVSYDDMDGLDKENPLLSNGKPNYTGTHERLALNSKSLIELTKIFAKPSGESADPPGCFMAHHAIILLKNGKYSSIEICFHCKRIRVSQDINLTDYDIDKKKWSLLESFFVKNGFKYELP